MSNQKTLDTSDVIPVDIAMGGRSYVHRLQSANMNMRSYEYWLHLLRCIALSSFEWTIPDNIDIDPRYIELTLLDYGLGAFFDMSEVGAGWYAFAQAVPMSRLNMYWNPNRIQLMSANGGVGWKRHAYYWTRRNFLLGHRELMQPDAAICYDNMNRHSIMPILRGFARRLANIDRKIDININAQANPVIMDVDEKQRKDAINLFMQITGNEPFILANRNRADLLNPQVLDMGAPYTADKLQVEKSKILYEVLTLCGVDNTNTEKKERMIDGEATANNEEIMLMRRSRLAGRLDACKKVKKLWGIDISVKYGVPHLKDGSNQVDMAAYDDDDGQQQTSVDNQDDSEQEDEDDATRTSDSELIRS